MRNLYGIWLPETDQHFAAQLAGGPIVDGKGTYQFKKYQAALKFVAARDHAVDVGAHVGLWSRVMARDFKLVTAFEPLEAHRSCFSKNVQSGNVELFSVALGDKRRKANFSAPLDNSGNACVAEDGEECHVVALDSLIMRHIDLLKIDVEGYEKNVVVGGEQTIRRDRPVIIVEQKKGNAERYGLGRWDAVKLLKDWGMREAAVMSGDHIMTW